VVEDVKQALELQDLDIRVAVGDLGDPQTCRRLKAEDADLDDSVDILQLAGSTHALQFKKMLGQSLARRVLGTTTRANVIGKIESLLIAEAPVMRTPLVGKTLLQSKLREAIGINVVGLWERGRFNIPTAQTLINSTTVLLLAGSADQFNEYDEKFGRDSKYQAPVLILGGGRAAADALMERNIDYRIIEKKQKLIEDERYIYGSAADINTLMQAGIKKAPSIIITAHDDPTNIYLPDHLLPQAMSRYTDHHSSESRKKYIQITHCRRGPGDVLCLNGRQYHSQPAQAG